MCAMGCGPGILMTELMSIRAATPQDAPMTAAIKSAWIDDSDWLTRLKSRDEIEQSHRDRLIPNHEVHVIGTPVAGYIALDDENFVTSLFCEPQGAGLGRAMLDHAKARRPYLQLWSFEANTGACRFYEREGFVQVGRAEDESEEKLPDILYRWEAA